MIRQRRPRQGPSARPQRLRRPARPCHGVTKAGGFGRYLCVSRAHWRHPAPRPEAPERRLSSRVHLSKEALKQLGETAQPKLRGHHGPAGAVDATVRRVATWSASWSRDWFAHSCRLHRRYSSLSISKSCARYPLVSSNQRSMRLSKR